MVEWPPNKRSSQRLESVVVACEGCELGVAELVVQRHCEHPFRI